MVLMLLAMVLSGGVQFDTTVSVGNLLTMGVMIIAGIAAWNGIGYRVKTMERWIEIHQKEVDIREALAQELKTGVALLNQSMEALARRLEAQEFSANRDRRDKSKAS
jgi:predicted RND superfamily exporter protein